MKTAIIQMDIAWHDKSANFKKALIMSQEAKNMGAEIIVFPEMFATGFSMNTAITAETMSGATPEFLRSLARKNRLYVIGGFVLYKRGGKPNNAAIIIDREGKDITVYAKRRLFGLAGEERHHMAGKRPALFGISGIMASCFICFDLRFPELFSRISGRCSLFTVLASWPSVRQSHWETLLHARAIENQIFVVGANRVGSGGGEKYKGGSMIIGPDGRVCAKGGRGEQVVCADIDFSEVEKIRGAQGVIKK